MDPDTLDKRLEPTAELLLLALALIAVATLAFFIVNVFAKRSREKAHNKLSASKRTKHSHIDLFAGAAERQETTAADKPARRPSRSSGSSMIDLGKRDAPPTEPTDPTP